MKKSIVRFFGASVLVVAIVSPVGASGISAGSKMVTECTSNVALKNHYRAVLDDGETQSDWLTHLNGACRLFAYESGKVLNDVLNDAEIPYADEREF